LNNKLKKYFYKEFHPPGFGAKSCQMGITGLLPLLKSVTRQVHVEQLAGESVAIDAYSWLHKGIYTCIADIYHQRPTTA
jgi:hypothetical protein